MALTAAELWMTRHDALDSANSAYDRSLLGALKSIDANISIASGGLSVELPYTMFEFFELTASGQVFFRVSTSDGLVELGSADLPAPPAQLVLGRPEFYDAMYFGEAVRLAAYQRVLDSSVQNTADRQSVLIQVGESTRSRQEFTSRFVRNAALRDLAILLLLIGCTAAAVAAAFHPLVRLAREVQARQPDDLTPVGDKALPSDLAPLVAAVNQHMSRTRELIAQQRQFLDDASHQLRTHLTTLQMQVDYARREEDPCNVANALEAIGVEISRVTRSTQQLLALGRSGTVLLDVTTFSLEPLLRAVALEHLPSARIKLLDLGIDVAPGSLQAVGDDSLLREALSNLVANAIAYTPPNGSVTLRAYEDEGSWRVAVEDTGPGMSLEERATLGQRFRRGKQAAGRGTGLGIAIARSIAERHSGGLDLCESENTNQGLRAVIWWPRPSL
ncbi:MAG: sensor histidine kinase [Alcaligenaceae bacterium]|nr:MAG: sensor histidine kinase [Alcaligenaceae bacterium]